VLHNLDFTCSSLGYQVMGGPTLLEAVKQKLLDINGQLKDIAAKAKASGHEIPEHFEIKKRPASARARPATAPGPSTSPPFRGRSRPQSARSVASAPIATPEQRSTPPQAPEIVAQKVQFQPKACQVNQEATLKADFHALLELVGAKAAARFSSFQQCFRRLDTDSNGKVEVSEIRDLLRIFHMPESAADQLFDHLDTEKTGSLDFQVVADVLGSYIKPGYRPLGEKPRVRTHAPPLPQAKVPESPRIPAVTEIGGAEVDLTKLADIIGSKAKAKYRNTRDCFRWLDEAKTGYVTRPECLQFLETFGYNATIGNQVYEALLPPGQSEVEISSFLRFFGPHIHPRYEDIARQREVGSVAPRPPTPAPENAMKRGRPPTPAWHRSPGPTADVEFVPPAPPSAPAGEAVLKEDNWSAAPTSLGCSEAVSNVTSSIPPMVSREHRPCPPPGQPRRPSGTGTGQAALRQPKTVPAPVTERTAKPRRPQSARLHRVQSRRPSKTIPQQAMGRSVSGHCLYCGRNEQGMISTEMLRASLAQRWGVIA